MLVARTVSFNVLGLLDGLDGLLDAVGPDHLVGAELCSAIGTSSSSASEQSGSMRGSLGRMPSYWAPTSPIT
jgi:hypothetical protein